MVGRKMAAAYQAALAARSAGAPARSGPDCAEILRKLTALFLCDTEHLGGRQLGLYDDILSQLIPQAGSQALAELSASLSAAPVAPLAVTRFLAAHADALVAAPILAKASWLPERDLFDIIKTASPAHLLAIAARKELGEKLTDLLIARAHPAVRAALAENPTARLSEDSYRILFKSAERDEQLAEKLGHRPDLPARLSREFVAAAMAGPRARFIKAAPPATQASLQNTPRARSGGRMFEDYSAARTEVAALSRAAKLGDSSVNRFAVSNDYAAVIAALALLSDVAIETIEPLMDEDRLGDLIVACKASRLSWATAMMIIRNRPGCSQISEDDLAEGRKRFDRLSLSEAQWTTRFGPRTG
jgi:uncharacterized protein (DUF2336 family)